VRDSGIGISESDQAKLFTSFFRADNPATRRVPGTGLGLVIARQLVRLHGGELMVRSQAGAGTEVSFFVPRSQRALTLEVLDSTTGDALAAS
jgi:signal transduction histidine kinase